MDKYAEFDLPLDTMWSDIDYLDRYRDFTFDPVNFKGLADLVNSLHDKNMKYIPIIDAGIAKRQNSDYAAYNQGVEKDVFIKASTGDDFVGRVWPGDAVYPDFMAEKTVQWWKDQLTSLYNTIKFDGLWEDMNEASNFCNGACY